MAEQLVDADEKAAPSRFYLVDRADEVRSVLGNEDCAVAAYGRGYEVLKLRSEHDFSNIEFALNYLPVAHDGARHVFLRDRASKYLQSKNDVLKGTRTRLVAQAAAVFAKNGRIDLVREVADPIVAGMIKDLSGMKIDTSPSLIFDPSTSLRKRRMLNDELGRLIAQLRQNNPQADDDDIGISLAFAVLANDASKGLILANLSKILSDNVGKRLVEIKWPALPIETGIRFIDRIARCPVQHRGVAVPKDAVLRAAFGALSHDGDATSLFGVGRHVCLGRGFFWAFWRDFVSALGRLTAKVVAVDIGPSSNRVFAIPDHVFVEVAN